MSTEQAQAYAERLGMTFFEVSPLCNFNITESFTELARIVLMRHGMDRLWRPNKGKQQKCTYFFPMYASYIFSQDEKKNPKNILVHTCDLMS